MLKVCVANVANVIFNDVADGVEGLLIDVTRRVTALDRYVHAGNWPKEGYPLSSKFPSQASFNLKFAN